MMIIKHQFFIKSILTFLILLSISNIVNANINPNVTDTEYNCFIELNNKLLLGFVNGQGGYIDICTTFMCVNGYISQMSITSKSNTPVNSTDFMCFNNLTFLRMINTNISGDFLYTPSYTSRFDLVILTPLNFSITSPIKAFKSLLVNNSNITSINLSFISSIPIFRLTEDTIDNIKYINDLTSLVTMNTMVIPCSSILNFTNLQINISLQLTYLESFNVSSMELFSTWTKIYGLIEISGRNQSQSFPYPRLMNSRISSLTIQHPLIQESNPIDLSSMVIISTIQIYQATFNINNSLPFINYPSSLLYLTLSNGNFSSFKIDSLPSTIQTLTLTNCNIKTELPKSVTYSLILDNNEITGTIDQSYCSIFQFSIKNNNLTGTIPSCYTCFRNSSLLLTFGGNQGLTNIINNSPCTTIKPKILLPMNNNRFTIYGNDLGWVPPISIIPSGAVTTFVGIQYNHMFVGYILDTTQISIVELSINNQNFTMTAQQSINPTIQSIQVDQLNIQFNGTGFSYDVNDINVMVGNVNCNVTGSTYYGLNCTLSSMPTGNTSNIQTVINVLTRSVNVQLSMNGGQVPMLSCPMTCSDGQYCNNINQTCQCKSGFKENSNFGICTEICPNNCSFSLGQGQCVTGVGCTCNPGFTGSNCSQSYCPLNCSGSNGVCNIQTKTCTCNQLWIGQGCQNPDWKVTSTSLVSPQGGPLAIGGWFGNVNNSFIGLYVSVDNKQVMIYSTSPSQLVGDVGPGTGSKTVTVTNYNITKSYQFQYTPSIIQCLKSCSGQGQCNTTDGTCKCNQGYTGFDCSISIDTSSPPPTTTVNSITASTQLEVQDTVYQINIDRLVELDIGSNIVNSIELSNNWNYTLLSNNLHLFNQSFNGGNASQWISLTLEEVQVTRMNQFAGTSYELSKDSIKITVEINQYQFNNTLNTLQLQMSTNVGLNSTNGGGCSSDVQSFDLQSLNYITITKNTKVMYGRFINTILSEGRPTLTTTTIISQNSSSLIIGLNLPHSQHYLIDPDFSLLLSNRDQSSCQSNSRSWVLPVAVAVPIVCVAIIAIVVAIVIKKNRTSIKLKMRSVSMSGLSKKFNSRK